MSEDNVMPGGCYHGGLDAYLEEEEEYEPVYDEDQVRGYGKMTRIISVLISALAHTLILLKDENAERMIRLVNYALEDNHIEKKDRRIIVESILDVYQPKNGSSEES